ncbi:Coiled-coil domain-containing protein 43 [Characodon lateralis]|uniref:Coiled-coil domain-containing protein 43 n=1 Tax=Characodon lateralis TaxID=208331 RepID=A0ABU7E1C6_9TELE|nr:Coiled-coil domain-containing protein 43 [Characodon lateralis]
MAAPVGDTGEFESWLNDRLDPLEVDREVYGAYILGILKEEESDEEKEDALQGILSAFLDEDTIEEVCKQIINHWKECCNRLAARQNTDDAEVQAIASMIEKQAQIVVKQKEPSESTEAEGEPLAGNEVPGSDRSLFRNTNVEEVLSRQKQKRDQAREDAQKKKETDKMQREKDKLTKQDRKEKEKKRTQKGERKR